MDSRSGVDLFVHKISEELFLINSLSLSRKLHESSSLQINREEVYSGPVWNSGVYMHDLVVKNYRSKVIRVYLFSRSRKR